MTTGPFLFIFKLSVNSVEDIREIYIGCYRKMKGMIFIMKIDECLEAFRNIEKMGKYLKEKGFDFVITAKNINTHENQEEIIISCTNLKKEV